MNLFIQGMRRSGTTILYDALCADPGLRCFYEPFREEGETPGGGSGAREGDAFAETRELRRRFRERRYPDLAPEDFNWGGPRKPELELGPELPEHCRGFLAELLEQGPDVVVKLTRAYDKIGALAEVDPDAFLVHVVRDPRSVAASMMLGRTRKREQRYADPDAFFTERERRKLWSSHRLSQLLLRRRDYAYLARPPNHVRILAVWRHTFESTRREGRRLFGDRYIRLRNEDLRADPGGTLASLYEVIARPLPDEVETWARGAVRPPEEPLHADDPRWGEALARLGMHDALEQAGYPELAALTPRPRRSQRLTRAAGRLTRFGS